jgi:uncharacterized 2Fe-2S/4Fe-4S cluster protein (DUF4445 family)
MPTVTIVTDTRTRELAVPAGRAVGLAELLRAHGLPLNTRCGGRGLCDACVVNLGGRRARGCEVVVVGGECVEIPMRSLAGFAPQVESRFVLSIPLGRDPLVSSRWGAAVDIGTTTVAVLLFDLHAGVCVSTQSAFNEQIHLGEDVLTRIMYATGGGLGELRAAVARTVAALLEAACVEAGITGADLAAVTFAGNTTMLHLLIGVDPTSMGVAPFTPVFLEHRVMPLAEVLGEGFAGEAHLLPGASAYVGADIMAGVVTCGMQYEAGTSLLVDVGTNGEIVLHHGGVLLGCATAAGPAFEGAGLTSGMRAGTGAISDVGVDPATNRPVVTLIGTDSPKDAVGVCGSGYIDLLAVGRRAGWLSETGRFLDSPAVSADKQLQLTTGGKHGAITVSEHDVSRLLTAKAAIAAGIETLLKHHSLSAADVSTLFLAGGFGAHLNVSNAIACGLLPGFRAEQVRVVGNTSLGGAMAVLLDKSLLAETRKVATLVRPVELNADPDFEDAFILHLSLE